MEPLAQVRAAPLNGKLLMVVSAFLTATGQLFWKWGWDKTVFFFVGFACYAIGALLMIRSLSTEKLSVAYPLMSLSYFFALGYGYWLLEEPITPAKLLAVVLIGIGVSLTTYER